MRARSRNHYFQLLHQRQQALLAAQAQQAFVPASSTPTSTTVTRPRRRRREDGNSSSSDQSNDSIGNHVPTHNAPANILPTTGPSLIDNQQTSFVSLLQDDSETSTGSETMHPEQVDLESPQEISSEEGSPNSKGKQELRRDTTMEQDGEREASSSSLSSRKVTSNTSLVKDEQSQMDMDENAGSEDTNDSPPSASKSKKKKTKKKKKDGKPSKKGPL